MLIVLAEDDRETCKSLGEFLRDHGHEVLECENGAQALQLVEKCPVNLVVSDIHMSVMNGIQLFQAVRGIHSVPFILMTAYDEFLDDLSVIPELECICMLKPLDLERLSDLVQEVEQYGSLMHQPK